MTELEQIVASVARALELSDPSIMDPPAYSHEDEEGEVTYLEIDGSNLFDPYWRCRCMDWLFTRGYFYELMETIGTFVLTDGSGKDFSIACNAAEFPARAIHALMERKP